MQIYTLYLSSYKPEFQGENVNQIEVFKMGKCSKKEQPFNLTNRVEIILDLVILNDQGQTITYKCHFISKLCKGTVKRAFTNDLFYLCCGNTV
jgi:hypothetical protein